MYDSSSPFALVFIARIKNADRFQKNRSAPNLKILNHTAFKFEIAAPRDFVNYVFSRAQSAASLNLFAVVPIVPAAAV